MPRGSPWRPETSPPEVHHATTPLDRPPVTPTTKFYRIVDISDPAHPKEVGRWWYPGQRAGDPEPAPNEIPLPDNANQGVRPHNVDVFPIFARNLAFVSEEAVQDGCADGPKHMSVWDIADETKPRLISVVPYAANSLELCKRGGRYGPHNIYEHKPYGPTYKSDRFVVTTWFAGGVRIFDLADPTHPLEAAYYVPGAPADSPKHAAQINDVFVDDRGIVYACDRFTGGLYILSSDVLKP